MATGLPGFNGAQTGTSIAITAPVFSDEALSELPWLCLRNLWPKLKAEGKGKPPISVLLRVSGHSLQVPDPSTTPPYDGYWRALTELRQGRGETITYYKETTGSLAIQHTVRSNKYQDDPRRAEHEQRPQHIALLRAPELVVKYLDGGRSLAAENIGFTGVFKADQHADHAFALAEPPTHDDWQAASVRDKRYRGIVNQTLKKIRQHVRDFVAPHSTPATPANGSSLASLSNQFAELLPGLIGSEAANAATRAEPEEPVAGKRQRRARPHVRIQPDQEVLDIEGKPYIVFRMDVTHAKDSECTRVSADVYPVVSGGAREGDPPRGASVPRVAWWESPRGAKLEGDSIVVGPRQQGSWSLYVPVVDANAVALELRASSGEAE